MWFMCPRCDVVREQPDGTTDIQIHTACRGRFPFSSHLSNEVMVPIDGFPEIDGTA
jgi:hypothetical protein